MVFSLIPSSPHLCFRRKPTTNLILPIRCSSSASSPWVSTQSTSVHFDLKTYWTTLIAEINQKLDEAIPIQYPEQIYEAMRYSVLGEGAKRAPPIMCVAACELFGGNRIAAFPTACALEMVLFLFDFLSKVFPFSFLARLFFCRKICIQWCNFLFPNGDSFITVYLYYFVTKVGAFC